MSTRSSTRPYPSFKVHKIQRHGIDLFMFNAAEHHPSKVPFLAVVLRPTAQAIGLNPLWFVHALNRSRNEELTRSVKEFEFEPSVFLRYQLDITKDGRGSRARPYQCLPITKMEVLLNGIDVERLKNPQARSSILNLQKTINEAIEHYYHKGVAINKKAKKPQLENAQDILEQHIRRLESAEETNQRLKARNAELTDENCNLQEDREDLLVDIDDLEFDNETLAIDLHEATTSQEQLEVELRSQRLLGADLYQKIENTEQKYNHVLMLLHRLEAKLSHQQILTRTSKEKLRTAEELAEDRRLEIVELNVRVTSNHNSRMKYKAMVAEYRMALDRLREDLPGFKSKKLSRLPSFLRRVLGQFLESTRDCFQSVLEQKKLTEEFKVMTLNLFPEMTAREYDTIAKDFGVTAKAAPPETFDNEPNAKLR